MTLLSVVVHSYAHWAIISEQFLRWLQMDKPERPLNAVKAQKAAKPCLEVGECESI